jgi:hypothetical protein
VLLRQRRCRRSQSVFHVEGCNSCCSCSWLSEVRYQSCWCQ